MARGDLFTTIRSEGALLPADFLQTLVEPKATLDGLTPADYHLPGTEKLNEAASRAWNHLIGVWTAFQSASQELKPGDRATTVTREKWLLPLFQELGYGRLQAARAFEIEGKAYPISHSWQQTPIHLVGRDVDLDRRTPGVAGAARTSPHGLLQEFLNRSGGHLWGIVSNGLKLRLLRDNRSFTRQAYVEFDLAGMMDGQVFADFVLLWLVCHQSRVEGEPAEQCWLEKWSEAAKKGGTRALDDLRDGVQRAIEALGRGFLKHSGNGALEVKLVSGSLTKQDYYRQLLREVYRLIFLFVAEDRELLLVPGAAAPARERYVRFYSVARLRRLAERRRGTQHDDLWRGLSLVFAKLSSSAGAPELAVPALGSFLWSEKGTPDLDTSAIANADLLDAIRALAFTAEGGIRRAVDYRNLGPEELGSVYESLLELHPDLNADAGTFDLRTAAGHERKTTGSYYTPTSLIECLLDSALNPVLDEAAKKPDPANAILKLKVCDPACGSGHFLIAAGHRIAARLAAIRTGDEEPSPTAVRSAVRDVVGRCLYGVDANPMAVELCKVNLWLEAIEPGKPLSFLEHHIQSGNSLIGATPTLLAKGIPEEAFDPIEGDDKEVCRELKKRNNRERAGFRRLPFEHPWDRLGDLASGLAALDDVIDDSFDGLREKERRWEEHVHSIGYEFSRLWADAWCAAFVWRKTRDRDCHPVTEDMFRTLERNPKAAPQTAREEVRTLAAKYQFFHWHLAFPGVFQTSSAGNPAGEDSPGWTGGFDAIIGNPPWERIKLDETEWFASYRPDIARAKNASVRKRLISALREQDPQLMSTWNEAVRQNLGEAALVRHSGRYPLSGRGDVNTYALFAELNTTLIHASGRIGCIVPSGIATDDTTKQLFGFLVSRKSLTSLFDFRNKGFFPGAAGAQGNRFCLLTLTGPAIINPETYVLFRGETLAELRDENRCFPLSSEDFLRFNPNTRTCPILRTRRDATILGSVYQLLPILVLEDDPTSGDPWGLNDRIRRLFDMANPAVVGLCTADSDLKEGRDRAQGLMPVYEAKMIHQYNYRFADYRSTTKRDGVRSLPQISVDMLRNPIASVSPRYWAPQNAVHERVRHLWSRDWLLAWRDITSGLDERTVISTVMPIAAADFTLRIGFPHTEAQDAYVLLALLNSFPFDYCARQKLGGTHLADFVFKQLPSLTPRMCKQPLAWSSSQTVEEWLRPRVLELVYTSWALQPFARDCGWNGPPFEFDAARRLLLRAEIDAISFLLYGMARDDVDYVMETFPIVRRNDEAAHGEYRTKRVILELYDQMQRAIQTGTSYRTVLDPPPADPCVAHSSSSNAAAQA